MVCGEDQPLQTSVVYVEHVLVFKSELGATIGPGFVHQQLVDSKTAEGEGDGKSALSDACRLLFQRTWYHGRE